MISSGEMTVRNPLSPSYIYSSNVSDHYRSSHSDGGFGANQHLALCFPPSHGWFNFVDLGLGGLHQLEG